MRVLFVSPNFPPEVNAPATRLFEHAREWVRLGGEVDVLTDVPNYPEGVVYPGYENRYSEEEVEGIRVHRVPMYVTANEGALKRIASFVSFMASAVWHARRLPKPDLVVATSPQFFCALAGRRIAKRFGVPFVLEIRDLWPESIVAVGAMERNAVIRAFERIERGLYRDADHVVSVTDSFVSHIVEGGADPADVTVLKSGADVDRLAGSHDLAEAAVVRREFGWDGAFVAAYVGTIGMAHRAEILLEAAARCPDPDIRWVVIGTGAERDALEAAAAEAGLPNFQLIDKQSKARITTILGETDVSVVHLRDTPLFRTVIPSKIFEAMALGVPIALGVRGETQTLVEAAGAGLAFAPEDADALVETVLRLKQDRGLYEQAQIDGGRYIRAHFDRPKIARRYWNLLADVAGHPHARVPVEPSA